MVRDEERDRFGARAARYASVGLNLGGAAVRIAASRASGGSIKSAANATILANALGSLKGPMMKVAQMMATIPDLLPPEYADEFQKLQAEAPPMGASFVSRRMRAELGENWKDRFAEFAMRPAAAASLGQVHRARDFDGRELACKLQYPEMSSAIEADLGQLKSLFALHRQFNPVIDTREIVAEIGARIREELDYDRERRNVRLFAEILSDEPRVRIPGVHDNLSTRRLLTLDWVHGDNLRNFENAAIEQRNQIAICVYLAWWRPFVEYGVIHGDPHLGNYTVVEDGNRINLLDFGCIRIFPPKFVQGVIELYRGLLNSNDDQIAYAYQLWGFKSLSRDIIDILNIWARFIYGPLLEDRERTLADGISPGQYGRREVYNVHMALRKKGPLLIPREFVFLDRAAIGLGAAFIRLGAKLNFHRMFEGLLGEQFSMDAVEERQRLALARAGLAQDAGFTQS